MVARASWYGDVSHTYLAYQGSWISLNTSEDLKRSCCKVITLIKYFFMFWLDIECAVLFWTQLYMIVVSESPRRTTIILGHLIWSCEFLEISYLWNHHFDLLLQLKLNWNRIEKYFINPRREIQLIQENTIVRCVDLQSNIKNQSRWSWCLRSFLPKTQFAKEHLGNLLCDWEYIFWTDKTEIEWFVNHCQHYVQYGTKETQLTNIKPSTQWWCTV